MKHKLRDTIFLIGVALLLGALICEAFLRITKPVHNVGISHQPVIYERDERLGYKYVKHGKDRIHRNFEIDNLVLMNSDGFHDVERGQASEQGRQRIVTIGDSFTACMHVPTGDTWTQVLERKLRDGIHSSIDVINLGLDGTSTDVHLGILSSYLRRNKVNTALLAFYENDISDISVGTMYREVHDGYVIAYQNNAQREQIMEYLRKKGSPGLIRALYGNSYFLRTLINGVDKHSVLRSNYVPPWAIGIKLSLLSEEETRSRAEAVFRELDELCKREAVTLYIAPLPTKKKPGGSYDALREGISPDLLGRFKIVDLFSVVESLIDEEGLTYDQLFWKYDGHFSAEGNRIIGLAMSIALTRAPRFLSEGGPL
jgi:hypothetical protein